MIIVHAKQIVVSYMINFDKFEISKSIYKRFSNKLKKVLNEKENKYLVLDGDLQNLINDINSMFEENNNVIYLKKQYSRQDLYNELNLPYEVICYISDFKELNNTTESYINLQV